MDWGKLFFSADGRIGRQSFWIGFLILLGVGVVLGWIPILGAIVSLALIYPWVCLYSKRFHDMGKSGWLAVLPVIVPGVLVVLAFISGLGGLFGGAAFSEASEGAGAGVFFAGLGMAMLFGLAAFFIWAGATLWAGLGESEPGANRYGEPPSLPIAGVGAPSHPPRA